MRAAELMRDGIGLMAGGLIIFVTMLGFWLLMVFFMLTLPLFCTWRVFALAWRQLRGPR